MTDSEQFDPEWEKLQQDLANVNECSFDPDAFEERIGKGEEWVKFIVAHLYIDHVVTNLISDQARNDKYIADIKRLGLSGRIDICVALGYINQRFRRSLKKLNSIRNRLAHNLAFDLDDHQLAEFVEIIRADLSDEIAVQENINAENLNHVDALRILVFSIEAQRIISHKAKIENEYTMRKLIDLAKYTSSIRNKI